MFGRRLQDSGAVRNSVYIASLLDAPTSAHFGNSRYTAGTAFFGGEPQPNSIITEVQNGLAIQRVNSWLTLELGGRFERFSAILGRDDKLAVQGPAYCIFEVHADGVKVFRSEAIRSSVAQVNTDGSSFPKRRAPQPVDLSVRGVKSLRLVTRYANEFSQAARHVHRASGCVWGGAQLVSRTAVELGQQVGSGPLRDAIRKAVVTILEAVPPPSPKDPLKVGIPPLRIESSGSSPLRTGETEIVLRNDLTTQVTNIWRSGRAKLVAMTGTDAEALAAALPAEGPARGNSTAVAAIARGLKADLLIFGSLASVGTEWRVTLRLIETTKGNLLKEATVPVGSVKKTTDDL
jgi:hypothetical protein